MVFKDRKIGKQPAVWLNPCPYTYRPAFQKTEEKAKLSE
jgi:hypothetical protein